MRSIQVLAPFFFLLLLACNNGPEADVKDSEQMQTNLLARPWVLESAYSNADSVMAQLQPRGSKLFLEVDNSYTFLTPEGSSTTGIWKVDSSGSYLLLAPAGQAMKKCLIKTLEQDQLVTYCSLDSLDKKWVEETYVQGP